MPLLNGVQPDRNFSPPPTALTGDDPPVANAPTAQNAFAAFAPEEAKALEQEERTVRFAAMEAQARVDFLLGLAQLEKSLAAVSDPDAFREGWEAGVGTLAEEIAKDLGEDQDGDGSLDGEELARMAIGEEARAALAKIAVGTQQRRWRRRQAAVTVAMANLKGLAAQTVDQQTLDRLRNLARELIWRNRLLIGGDDNARDALKQWNKILGWDRFVLDSQRHPESALKHLHANPWKLSPDLLDMARELLEAMNKDRGKSELATTYKETASRRHRLAQMHGLILDGFAGYGDIAKAKVEMELKPWEVKRLRKVLSTFHKETKSELKHLKLCASKRFDAKNPEHQRAADKAWITISGMTPMQDHDDDADQSSVFCYSVGFIPERIREKAALCVLSPDPAIAQPWGVFIEELEDRMPDELMKFTPEQKGAASLMALGVPPPMAVQMALKALSIPAREQKRLESMVSLEGDALLDDARKQAEPRKRWTRKQLDALRQSWPKRLSRYLAIHHDLRWAARLAWRDADLEPRPDPDEPQDEGAPVEEQESRPGRPSPKAVPAASMNEPPPSGAPSSDQSPQEEEAIPDLPGVGALGFDPGAPQEAPEAPPPPGESSVSTP